MSAMLVALGTTLTLSPTAASGATVSPRDAPFGTIIADLNNDGIPDQATLGHTDSADTQCSVTVRYGQADGTLGTPNVHPYTLGPQHLCPDEGVAVKLGHHKRPDLVVAASFDENGTTVLTNFEPVATYPGVIQPQLIRTGVDFNNDGRQDVIEASFQTSDLITLLNTKQGTLVLGPIHACAFRPQYVIADFDQDGNQDMLLSDFCAAPPGIGLSAKVLFGNGQPPATLISTQDTSMQYTVFAIDLNYDGVPDAGVIATPFRGTPTVSYFRNDGHGHFTPTAGP